MNNGEADIFANLFYENCIVACFDLLGTSKRLYCDDPQEITNLYGIYEAIGKKLKISSKENIHQNEGRVVAMFSDTIIIGVRLWSGWAESELSEAISAIGDCLTIMLRHHRCARGGLAYGGLTTLDNFITGSGICAASALDKSGGMPIVCVDPQLFSYVLKAEYDFSAGTNGPEDSFLWDSIWKDHFLIYKDVTKGDCVCFVNYMRNWPLFEPDLGDLIKLHENFISENLSETMGTSVYEKYVFLANYHQYVVAKWITDGIVGQEFRPSFGNISGLLFTPFTKETLPCLRKKSPQM